MSRNARKTPQSIGGQRTNIRPRHWNVIRQRNFHKSFQVFRFLLAFGFGQAVSNVFEQSQHNNTTTLQISHNYLLPATLHSCIRSSHTFILRPCSAWTTEGFSHPLSQGSSFIPPGQLHHSTGYGEGRSPAPGLYLTFFDWSFGRRCRHSSFAVPTLVRRAFGDGRGSSSFWPQDLTFISFVSSEKHYPLMPTKSSIVFLPQVFQSHRSPGFPQTLCTRIITRIPMPSLSSCTDSKHAGNISFFSRDSATIIAEPLLIPKFQPEVVEFLFWKLISILL